MKLTISKEANINYLAKKETASLDKGIVDIESAQEI
jgi:hypothetical protein